MFNADFKPKKIRLVSLKETIATHSASGRLLNSIISSLSQFERDVLAERTKEGLNAARARGRLGGRPKKDSSVVEKIVALYNTKQYTLSEIEDLTGVSTSTLYRFVKKAFRFGSIFLAKTH